MKTRDQRRRRRPLGSVFVGQKAKEPFRSGEGENHETTGSTAQAPAARLCFCGPSPTKTEPSGFCLMALAHYVCFIGEKAL